MIKLHQLKLTQNILEKKWEEMNRVFVVRKKNTNIVAEDYKIKIEL